MVWSLLGRVRGAEAAQSVSGAASVLGDDALKRLAEPLDQPPLRPVLVGGCPRSGTTLVGAMLGVGPEQLTVPEAQFKWTLLAGTDEAGQLDLGWAVDHLLGDWRFRLWQIDLGTPPSQAKVRYERLLGALVRAHGACAAKPTPTVWIDHTPANIRHALRLSRVLPGARFVNVVRDGRAVAASVIPLDWGPNNVFEAARWWATEVAMGLAATEKLGADVVATLRYEDLAHGRLTALTEACGRLDLTFDESTRTSREYAVQPYTARQHRYVSQEPLSARAHAWRADLSSREIETFEYLTGDLLAFLGYDLEFAGKARAPRTGHHVADSARAMLKRQLVDKARRLARRQGLLRPRKFRWDSPRCP